MKLFSSTLSLMAAAVALHAAGTLPSGSVLIDGQTFDTLDAASTRTTDTLTNGGQLTNASSFNTDPSQGMTFATFWFATRSNLTGPNDLATESSGDFIGVNSFTGSNAPNTDPDGNASNNFEFNDGDGTLELAFDAIDLSGFTSRTLCLNYWVASTGFESDDLFQVIVDDGTTQTLLLDLGEPELEALGVSDTTPATWQELTVDLEPLLTGGNTITLIIAADTNSGSENIFVDNIAFFGVPAGPVVLAQQDFNDLNAGGTRTTDSLFDGGQLTNASSRNTDPALGMTFSTFWFQTRSNTRGPNDPSTETTGDFIGVNSFTGNNAPNTDPEGGTSNNFEFNDSDGRVELTFDPVDISGVSDVSLSLDFWINITGYESDDVFEIVLSDGTTTQTVSSFGESELENLASFDGTPADWGTILIEGIETLFTGTQLSLIVAADTNSGSENIFIDNVVIAAGGLPPVDPTVVINEIRIDMPGSDTDEYFELFGDAGASLDGLTYVVIGDGSASQGSGVLEAIVSLDGQTIPADGYFVAAEASFSLATADFVTSINFENSDNVTHLLVRGFDDAATGLDLDTNDDGVLDITPWEEVVDSVALKENDFGELLYSDTVVGPDGSFVPGHVFRCNDGFRIGGFTAGSDDTPGAENLCAIVIPELTIPEIQGTGDRSTFEGQTVITTGVVTALLDDGFFVQDPTGDGNPATSDGLFVFVGSGGPSVDVGDAVKMTDEVTEFVRSSRPNDLPLTQFAFPTIELLSQNNPLPAPIAITNLPNEDVTAAIAFYEALEGMRVSVRNAVVSAPTSQFGEFAILTRTDSRPGSGFIRKSGLMHLRPIADEVVDYNPEDILVDNESVKQPGDPDSVAIQALPRDLVRSLTGVIDYTFSNYKIQPTEWTLLNRPLPADPSPLNLSSYDLTIASYNVLNYFDTVNNPSKDDASSNLSPAELASRTNKLVASIQALSAPDILALQEVENETITQFLGDALNTTLGTNYVARSFETSDARGIEPAFLYNTDAVTPLAQVTLSGETLPGIFQLADGLAGLSGVEAAYGPTSASPGREPLAGAFQANGSSEVVWVINNHFKSKGGDQPIFGINPPPAFVRSTEVQRKLQAQVVRDFADIILANDPDAVIIIIGDLNDFEFSEPGEGVDPVETIAAGTPAFENLMLSLPVWERYTFIFDGNAQVLDHVLVSPAASSKVSFFAAPHLNSRFPGGLLGDESTVYRASDHDPLVLGLDF